jgi:hypothetical protein
LNYTAHNDKIYEDQIDEISKDDKENSDKLSDFENKLK